MRFMKNFGNWILNKMTGKNYSGFFSKAGRLVKDSKDLWIYGNNTIDKVVYKSRGLNGVYRDVKKDYPGIKTRAVKVKDDFKHLFNINNSYSPTPKPTTSGGPGSKPSGKTGSPHFSMPKGQDLEGLVDVSEKEGLENRTEQYSIYDIIKGRKTVKKDLQHKLAEDYRSSHMTVKELAKQYCVCESTLRKYGKLLNNGFTRTELRNPYESILALYGKAA